MKHSRKMSFPARVSTPLSVARRKAFVSPTGVVNNGGHRPSSHLTHLTPSNIIHFAAHVMCTTTS